MVANDKMGRTTASSGMATLETASRKESKRPTDSPDWSRWLRKLGGQGRRAREFLGLSQDRLATLAGVSQGAVSRFEAGRGLATPMLVVLKINLALTRAIRTADPALLGDGVPPATEIEQQLLPPISDIGLQSMPLTSDAGVEEMVCIYRGLPEKRRRTFLAVVRATAAALTAGASID